MNRTRLAELEAVAEHLAWKEVDFLALILIIETLVSRSIAGLFIYFFV